LKRSFDEEARRKSCHKNVSFSLSFWPIGTIFFTNLPFPSSGLNDPGFDLLATLTEVLLVSCQKNNIKVEAIAAIVHGLIVHGSLHGLTRSLDQLINMQDTNLPSNKTSFWIVTRMILQHVYSNTIYFWVY
jgi:hypothetical protein